jgi:hypothetical protein
MRLLLRFSLIKLLIAGLAFAQSPPLWRSWDVFDGLKESYTTSITIDAQGAVWAKHGDVDMMSVLDGYTTRQIADPRSLGRVYSSGGQIWTFDTQGLKQYVAGRWLSHPIPELAAIKAIRSFQNHRWFLYPTRDVSALRTPARVSLLPRGPDRVLILTSESLLEYDASARHTRTIAVASGTKIGSFLELNAVDPTRAWIAAEQGLGKLDANQFTEYALNLPGFHSLHEPREGNGREVFASAISADGSSAVVRFDGQRWETVYLG